MRIEVRSTGWDDPAGAALRAAMEKEMRERYADRVEAVLAQADRATPGHRLREALDVEEKTLAYVGVAYTDGVPSGHAMLRWHGDDLELKRMYVAPEYRGTGVSTALLTEVEKAARSLGAPRIILQTGDRQPDAVRLYEREGYTHIPIFPPYELLPFSICMEKRL